jgi:aquaporin Z
LPYIAVIFASALAAASTTHYLFPQELSTISPQELNLKQALVGEFLFTFVLMWVILNVAIAKGTAKNAFYGIAIGAIVGAGAYAVGTISFAAFNPAVTLGLCLNGFLPWEVFLPYCAVQAIAAALAGFLFRSMRITDPEELPA